MYLEIPVAVNPAVGGIQVLPGEPNFGEMQKQGISPYLFYMLFWTYILQSQSSGRFYCGSTDNLVRRLRQHNDPNHHATKTTKRFEGPWILVWEKGHPSRSEAMALERKIKKRGIGRFLMKSTDVS